MKGSADDPFASGIGAFDPSKAFLEEGGPRIPSAFPAPPAPRHEADADDRKARPKGKGKRKAPPPPGPLMGMFDGPGRMHGD